MYARYVLVTIAQLLFTLVSFPLALVVVLFARGDGWLPKRLAWFQTPDASLDAGWKDGYFSYTAPISGRARYWLRVRWLWRNPAYGLCCGPLGLPYDPHAWRITVCERDTAGNLTRFRAETLDGRYFAYTDSLGRKFGYKLWWALQPDNTLLAKLDASRGTPNLPLCCTPGSPTLFLGTRS